MGKFMKVVNNVPIARKFSRISEDESLNRNYLDFLGGAAPGALAWNYLLENTPVVILGEGRSGKTHELRLQAEKLKVRGDFAFYLPLERFSEGGLKEALDVNDVDFFDQWLEDSSAEAFFLLDALDELKLRKGTFRRALLKIRSEFSSNLTRINIIVSCRPADWEADLDIHDLSSFRPKQNKRCATDLLTSGEEDFINSISKRKKESRRERGAESAQKDKTQNIPLVVEILPLGNDDIRQFSRAYAAKYAEQFCDYLERKDLWHLYRLPAEIVDGLNQYEATKNFGNIEEQLKRGIQRKLREASKLKPRALSLERAQSGAERVALATILLRQNSISIPRRAEATSGLSLSDVLTDWTASQQDELVGKPLFEPKSIGTVSFFHRVAQEYLGSQRLKKLQNGGMEISQVKALLFGRVGGIEVIKPSCRSLVSWVAVWNSEIRSKVLALQPELLFECGLPDAFNLHTRKKIIEAYVNRYDDGSPLLESLTPKQLRRLGDARLEPTVRKLWEKSTLGFEGRDLLLELILQTPLVNCGDLAMSAALDTELFLQQRLLAAQALIATGDSNKIDQLARNIVAGNHVEQHVQQLLPSLVPSYIRVDEAIKIALGFQVKPNVIGGADYAVYKLAKAEGLNHVDCSHLRRAFANEIWNHRLSRCWMFDAKSERGFLIDAAIVLCERTIPSEEAIDASWAFDAAVAINFSRRTTSSLAERELIELHRRIDRTSGLKWRYFSACVDLAAELHGKEGFESLQFYATTNFYPSISFTKSDLSWMLGLVEECNSNKHRLAALVTIAKQFDLEVDGELHISVCELIKDRPDWKVELDKFLNPPARELEDWEIKAAEQKEENIRKEEERIRGWTSWRRSILEDDEYGFNAQRRLNTLYNIQSVINQSVDRSEVWGCWDGDLIERLFGADFLRRLRVELGKFWRETRVKLTSERDSNNRRKFKQEWLLALSSVKADSESPGWVHCLDPDEVIQATRIACLELNGFASFLPQLDQIHPKQIDSVIIGEAINQIDQYEQVGSAEIIDDILHHGTERLQKRTAEEVASRFSRLLSASLVDDIDTLRSAVRLVGEYGSDVDKSMAEKELIDAFTTSQVLSLPQVSSMLVDISPVKASKIILEAAPSAIGADNSEIVAEALGLAFGSRSSKLEESLWEVDIEERVRLLQSLVELACKVISFDDNVENQAIKDYGLRHREEAARTVFVNCLLSTRSPATLAAIDSLINNQDVRKISSRLKQSKYGVAAGIADQCVMSMTSFQDLDREAQFQPYDSNSLHRVVIEKINALEHELLHAEDSPADLVRKASNELEVRRFIASYLRHMDQGGYTFSQESVVVDEKRTDIRLYAHSDLYATIELKREVWSVSEFESALTDQLVDKYLRHQRCGTGVLLIVQTGAKMWKDPRNGHAMKLNEVVDYLQSVANSIVTRNPLLQVSVKGIALV